MLFSKPEPIFFMTHKKIASGLTAAEGKKTKH
jgi:hypothetical protein